MSLAARGLRIRYGPRMRTNLSLADLGDFLNAILRSALGFALHELNIVDDNEVQASLSFQTARAGRELGDGERAGLVDQQR